MIEKLTAVVPTSRRWQWRCAMVAGALF